MTAPDVNPMIPFTYNGTEYVVHMKACDKGVIKLPTGEYVVVTSAAESYPPHILKIRDTDAPSEASNTPVFDAISASYFTFGTRTFKVYVPETASYFDGSLIRLPDGTMVVWGAYHESMTPAMEDIVHENDPRVESAGDRIYQAVEYS